jgi:ribosomal-protein-serine acetyltransferase
MNPVTLDGGIVLRPYRVADADGVFTAVEAERIRLQAWMPWVWVSTSPEDSLQFVTDAERRFAAGTAVNCGLFDGERVVGSVGAGIDALNRVAEVGYWISADYEGRGLVTGAMRALIGHLFDRGLHRLVIHAAFGNERSIAVAERLGFTYEGTEREALRMGESVHDSVVYGLLAREWSGG